jgi:hypothetical protein
VRRAARVDGNQGEIVEALRLAGWAVHPTHQLGHGFPDLVVSKQGVNLLVECKMPGEKLTPDEERFFNGWRGLIVIVFGAQDAVDKTATKLMRLESFRV